VVYADASSTGYAGYTVEHGCHVTHGPWTQEEAARSSTWRELRAVRMVLESLLPKKKNERFRWFSDNQNVVHILPTGSRKPDLQEEALAIFTTVVEGHICIEAEWTPTSNNEQADWLSHKMTGASLQCYFQIWMPTGGHAQLIVSLASTTHSYLTLIHDTGTLALKQ